MLEFLKSSFANSSGYLGPFWHIFWPFIVFLILFPIFKSTWMHWRQSKFKKEIKWVLLELKIPREILRTPQAMEQTLMAIHTLRNAAGQLREWYWDGEVSRWYSLEMASFGGETHFYIRTYYKQRRLVEAAFFSHYPDLEIEEVSDYVERIPANVKEMYAQGYELWGSEMLLNREGAYPIRSYKDFEVPEEDRQLDPMSVFLEVLSKLNPEEIVGIQFLIQPLDRDLHTEYDDLVNKLKEPKTKKEPAAPAGGDQLQSFARFIARSPGETDVLEAVERNLSKPAFKTIVRFVYLSPKATFYDSFARRGISGSFNQYGASDLNSFRLNYTVGTRTEMWRFPYIFPKLRNQYRRQRLLYTYRNRYLPPKPWMGRIITSYLLNWNFASRQITLNVESVATLFHPPTFAVMTAPHMKRTESRKAGPPAGLPLYGGGQSLERFQ